MGKLWYKKAADSFHEALPIGNGRLGGMVYGGGAVERISLNEDTLWSGFPMDKSVPLAFEGYSEAKALYKSGDVAGAEEVLWKKCLSNWTEAYQPAGALVISTDGVEQADCYCRELDLASAVALTSFESGGFSYKREVFSSNPADALVVRQESTSPEQHCEITLDCPHPHRFFCKDDTLFMEALAPSYSAPSYFKSENPIIYDSFEDNRALSYCVAVKPSLNGGSVSFEDGKIIIRSSDFVLYTAISTNFEGFDKQPSDSKLNPASICGTVLNKAAGTSFADLKAAHIADYRALFDRVELKLCGEDRTDLPTNERLVAYQEDNTDNGLAVLMFDYGRYLTIASSRENTQPTNLQGLWNEDLRAPWSANYTLNINTEMNYWHVEACNLSETHLPLIRMVEELAQKGTAIAKDSYHCRGWCAHHNTDLWRQIEPVGGESPDSNSVGYSFWNISGGWLARHIFEHYEYTNDLSFLREHFELLKGAALFMLDRLEENSDGTLMAPISTSPENKYRKDGKAFALSENCAMDIGVTRDIFTAFIKSAGILGQDSELVKEFEAALEKLVDYKIGTRGELCEWSDEFEETEPQHRHLSLLYGVYPGNSINADTPKLQEAVDKTMRLRGDEATGWGIAWKINVWARLENAEKAKICLDKALRPVQKSGLSFKNGGGLYPNMFGAHPPFQIDSNFGTTAGIVEMLMQCKNGGVKLLPALPKEWHDGSVKGLVAKGGDIISFEWADGKVIASK